MDGLGREGLAASRAGSNTRRWKALDRDQVEDVLGSSASGCGQGSSNDETDVHPAGGCEDHEMSAKWTVMRQG